MSNTEAHGAMVEDQPEVPTASPPTPVHVAAPRGPELATLVLLISGVIVVAALYLAREVLIPITLAVLLSFVLAPVVGQLRRMHLPRVVAVLLTVMVALGIIGVVGGLIGVQIASLAPDIPRYASTVGNKVNALQNFAVGHVSQTVGQLAARIRSSGGAKPAELNSAKSSDQPSPTPVPVEVHQPNPQPLEIAQRVLAPILNPLETVLIVLIVSIFILLQREDLRDRLIRLIGAGDLHSTTTALDDAAQRLSRYFLAQVAMNAVFGVVISFGLLLIGVPSPVLWGILAALLRFVPYIGSAIAALLPVVVAAGASSGWVLALETAGLFLLIETLTGQFLEPLIYGHSTGLSPAAVVVAAIFWTWLWGPIGLILSTPLTLCFVVLGRHVQRLEFLDVLLGDRPALTPVENFYQRMLANDPDEAQDQAELLLKERSLTAYYDEVALKGLQLAANDAQRGVLGDDKLERIKNCIRALVHDLADHKDCDPSPAEEGEAADAVSRAERSVPAPSPPEDAPERLVPAWRTEAPVLCIAGRGPLDEAASAMLAQLLSKHKLRARIAPYEAASREGISFLDMRGTAMVCISYLQLSGGPAHLRYLIRRLRARLSSGTPILAGLWPADDEALRDPAVQSLIGADYYTASLHEAVEICVQVSQATAADKPRNPAENRNITKIV